MTEKEFIRYSFRHSEIIEFVRPVEKEIVTPCLLLAVDFEQALFKLEPIDKEIYSNKDFWCRREYCRKPEKKKLRVV